MNTKLGKIVDIFISDYTLYVAIEEELCYLEYNLEDKLQYYIDKLGYNIDEVIYNGHRGKILIGYNIENNFYENITDFVLTEFELLKIYKWEKVK